MCVGPIPIFEALLLPFVPFVPSVTLATFKLGPIQVQDARQLTTLRPATQAVCSAVLLLFFRNK